MTNEHQKATSATRSARFNEMKEQYLEMARRSRAASKPGYRSVGEPGNDGPKVEVLIDCAEDLAKNYEPSGAIFIVEVDSSS